MNCHLKKEIKSFKMGVKLSFLLVLAMTFSSYAQTNALGFTIGAPEMIGANFKQEFSTNNSWEVFLGIGGIDGGVAGGFLYDRYLGLPSSKNDRNTFYFRVGMMAWYSNERSYGSLFRMEMAKDFYIKENQCIGLAIGPSFYMPLNDNIVLDHPFLITEDMYLGAMLFYRYSLKRRRDKNAEMMKYRNVEGRETRDERRETRVEGCMH